MVSSWSSSNHSRTSREPAGCMRERSRHAEGTTLSEMSDQLSYELEANDWDGYGRVWRAIQSKRGLTSR
jgi:hypothetical protein